MGRTRPRIVDLVRARLVIDPPLTDPASGLALAAALMEAVVADGRPIVRFYRPERAVAFSRRDRLEAGFDDACRAARDAGYAAIVRGPGGRAAAYGPSTLIVDQIAPVGSVGINARFDRLAEATTNALRSIGLDARVGELPDEYCPGPHSINVGGAVKVAGMAQRISRGVALTSMVLVVADSAELRKVIADVYAALGLTHDPARTGALADAAPGLQVDEVQQVLVDHLATDAERWTPCADVTARAVELREQFTA